MITQFPATVSEYGVRVAKGLISGAQPMAANGRNVATGAATNQPLWMNGSWALPSSSGVQMSIVSTSANDASAGTGVRTVEIHYLDANLAPQTESITMNGVTPVLTVATNIRFVQSIHTITVGSGKAAAGNISVSNGGVTYQYMAAGDLISYTSMRMVPAGKKIYVSALAGGASSGSAAAKVELSFASTVVEGHDYTSTLGLLIPSSSIALQDNSVTLQLQTPFAFSAGQVLGMSFSTDKAVAVVGSWFGWMENA